ncbi:MAG: tetratricopeptide repeat protein [Methylococcales bacterium]
MSKLPCYKKRTLVVSIVSLLLLLQGCNKEEDAEAHLQRGKEYFEKGEYEKAKLELKSSNQNDQETAETYYYLALLDEKNQQFRAMKENLSRTIELAPNFTDARIKLGKVLLLFGDFDQALEQAEFVLKDANQNLDALTLKSSILIRQKKTDQALAIVENILKDHPVHTDALSLKALIYLEREDYSKALELIDAAKKSDPKNVSLDLFKIQMDAKTNNIDAVIKDYQALVETNPENQEFKINLAKIYAQAGKLKEAEEILLNLVDAEPNNIKLELLLLDFYQATAQEKVEQKFLQFTELHKKQPRMLLALADWIIAKKNYSIAKQVLNTVIELEENSIVGLSAKTILAKIAFDLKNTEEARKIVDEILDANSNYDDAKILKARLLLVEGQSEEAIDLLTKVTWSKPDSDEAMLLLAQALLNKGDLKQADKQFASALEANPGNIKAFEHVYGKAIKANNVSYAKEILGKALQRNPDNLALLEKQGQINISEQDWEAAKKTVQKIASVPVPLAKLLATYISGQILQGQGNYVNAVEIYKELLVQVPENIDALSNLARCYESLNKRSEMVAYLNGSLSTNAHNVSAVILLSDLLVKDKQYEKASKLLTDLIVNEVRTAPIYQSLANIKLAQHDDHGAVEAYKEGLRYNPENVKLILSLASTYQSLGDYAAAALQYELLLRKDSSLDIAINNLAALLVDHFNDAEHLKRAGELAEGLKDSSNVYFKDTYAWVLIQRGAFREGLEVLNALVVSSPDVPVFRYHLAVAHHKNGSRGSAISELKQALILAKNKGGFPEQNAAEKLLIELTANAKQG